MGETTRCIYCDYKQWFNHPRYAYLLSDKRELNEETDPDTELTGPKHIGLTRHPFMRLNQQNRVKGFHTGAKPTNLHGQFWQHELIIGPFYHGGKRFKEEWRASARGMESRYKKAWDLVKKYNADKEFLAKNTPLLDGVIATSIVESTENGEVQAMATRESVVLEVFCRNAVFTRAVFQRPTRASAAGSLHKKLRKNSYADEDSTAGAEADRSGSCERARLQSEAMSSSISPSLSDEETISQSEQAGGE